MSKEWKPPKVAITRAMVESGKLVLEAMTSGENDNHSDDELVANIFYCMWETYWREVIEVKKKKTPSAILAVPKPSLVIPMLRKH
jgi:hypothetical protein